MVGQAKAFNFKINITTYKLLMCLLVCVSTVHIGYDEHHSFEIFNNLSIHHLYVCMYIKRALYSFTD